MARLKPPGLMRRIAALLLLVWLLGFVWFAVFLPRAANGTHTDGVIALTGAQGRIGRGLDMLRAGAAQRMLVSGVDSQVSAAQFAQNYGVDPELFACCLTLGYESFDTRSNAHESAAWIARNHIRSVRLVTTDWHMRRAAFDLTVAGPKNLVIVEDAVPSHPSFKMLFIEYNKLVARLVAWLIDWPAAKHSVAVDHDHH